MSRFPAFGLGPHHRAALPRVRWVAPDGRPWTSWRYAAGLGYLWPGQATPTALAARELCRQLFEVHHPNPF